MPYSWESKSMSRHVNKKKNPTLLIAIIFIVAIGLIFFIAFRYGTTSSDQQDSMNIPDDNGRPKGTPAPAVPKEEKPKSWTHAINDNYTIDFPSTWTAYATELTGGSVAKPGEKVTYVPIQFDTLNSSSSFEIDHIPFHPKVPTLEQRVSELVKSNFTKSDIQFHNLPAVSLHSSDMKVDKTIILCNYKDNIYIITATYTVDENAAIHKEIIDTMLEKFQFR